MIPGLPEWALPDSYPPPVPATPVLELSRARELARVPPAPGYGQDWDWERFMGTGLMAGVPVTLADGRIAMPRPGGGIDVLGEPQPGLTFVPTGFGGLWIKTDPPPGVPLIQALPNGDVVVLPLTHPTVAGQAGVYTDDAQAINAAAIQAGGSYGFGGRVILGPWHYNIQSPIVIPQQSTQTGTGVGAGGPVSLVGVRGATILQQNFSGICVYAHRSQAYGAQFGLTAQLPMGAIRDIVIDMTGAGAGSIGWDVGDGQWLDMDVETINGTSQPAVTFSSVTNTFTGAILPNGYPVMLLSGTAPTGFAFGKLYYVINAGLPVNTFQLAATPNGNPVVGTTNGTGLSINGCIGLHHTNQVFWSEKQRICYQSWHNAIAAVLDTMVPSTDHSHEYNEWDLTIFCDTGQQGIVLATGVNCNGRLFHLQGNMAVTSATGAGTPPGNIAAVTLCGSYDGNPSHGSRFFQTEVRMKVEGNPGNGTGTVYPYGFYSDGVGYVQEVTGHIAHSLGNPNVTGQDSNMNGAEFGFRGPASGDSYLTQIYPTAAGGTSTAQPAFPGFGAGNAMKNTAPDQLVTVLGGTITSISLNGQPTGAISGTFLVPSGASLSMAGTVAPTTYQWVNLAQNAY